MQYALSRTIDRVRQPEYTGENRCFPCTVLNVSIAAVVTVGIAFVSPPVSAVFFVAAVVVIYLRGYIIPGTPTITRRYFPERVLGWFDKLPEDEQIRDFETHNDASDTEIDQVGDLLLSTDVVEECADENDLCLTKAFERVWWRRIRQVRDEERAVSRLAAVLELDPDELSIEEQDGRFDVRYEGRRIGGWASQAAFLADLGVEPTLAEWIPDWTSLDDRQRTRLIASMRVFLEECPSCEATLEPVENTIKSCCSSNVVKVTVECPGCGDQVFDGTER